MGSSLAAILTVLGTSLRTRSSSTASDGRVIIEPNQGSSLLIEGAVRGMTKALEEKDHQLYVMRNECRALEQRLAECEARSSGGRGYS